ncbi:MAG: hypothetical protein JXQ76_07795 [Campylobacterales bacterium]|nr:hypothetical protein [Campylobacterales bacterium]
MQKNVIKTTQGVNINFTGSVDKAKIFTMVENCSHGKCECMNDDTKRKIKEMKVEETGQGEIKIVLTGDMEKAEIEEAIGRSKVI